jgi:hypothetical protein
VTSVHSSAVVGRGDLHERATQRALRVEIQTAQNAFPVAVTAGDKIEGLRQWASERCLSADRAGVDLRSESGSGGRVRRAVEPA